MSSQQVRCGLSPVLHGGFPDNDRAGLLRRLAVLADQAGFDAFWVEDHSRLPNEELFASQGDPSADQPLEAWTTLAYLAAVTTRVKLGAEVTPVTLRHPSQLAKTVSTLATLSGDRVIFGAGTGWHKPEYLTHGIPFENREARFAKSCEAIEIMRALWTSPAVDYAGQFYTLADARLSPKPGPIPIWFGGFSDHLLSAVVRYGDGWILGTNPDPAFVAERWTKLRALGRAAGRDPDEIRVAVPLMAHLSHDRARAQESLEGYVARGDFGRWLGDFFGENARTFGLWGTPEDALPKLKPYLDLGVRDFIFDLRPPGIAFETAELLATEILPRIASL